MRKTGREREKENERQTKEKNKQTQPKNQIITRRKMKFLSNKKK